MVVALLSIGCSKSADVARERQPNTVDAESESAPTTTVAPAAVEPLESGHPAPAFASPVPATGGRPPHPAIPAPLEEAAPAQDLAAAPSSRWLPGHWIWTGNEYRWQPGVSIYDVPRHELVPPRWVWDGEYWVFQDAGWTVDGTAAITVRPTAVPGAAADAVPEPGSQAGNVDLYVAPSSHAVYVWTGTWVAPPIVYPPNDASSNVDRYPVRTRSADAAPEPNAQPTEPPTDPVVAVGADPLTTEEEQPGDEEVELIPGVLHGGKRGEEERRLLEEQKEREAEEEEGVDSVYVPYYYQPDYYYRRYPPRRPPARPRPLPAPSAPR